MDDFSPPALAALDAPVSLTPWLFFLDIQDDVQRVTSSPRPLTFASNVPDPLLAGQTFGSVSALLEISQVRHQPGGSGSVSFLLSGLPGVDTATLNAIGDRTKWLGRRAAVWMAVLDPADLALVSVKRIYSGRMSVPRIAGDGATQTIAMEVLPLGQLLAEAGNSTYLDQTRLDAGDLSAAATLKAASGLRGSGFGGVEGAGGNGFGGGFDADAPFRFLP